MKTNNDIYIYVIIYMFKIINDDNDIYIYIIIYIYVYIGYAKMCVCEIFTS